jgi:hypothetical protein
VCRKAGFRFIRRSGWTRRFHSEPRALGEPRVATIIRVAGPLHVAFAGGRLGSWRVERMEIVQGEALPFVDRLEMIDGSAVAAPSAVWVLRGTTSNERYVTRAERAALEAAQRPLERPDPTRAALIPIRKSAAWWQLATTSASRVEGGGWVLPAVRGYDC